MAMVKDYKGDPPMAKGEAFDPSPENIDKRTKRVFAAFTTRQRST